MAKKPSETFGLKYSSKDIREALQALSGWLEERVKLVEDKRITDSVTAIKLMAAIKDFADDLGQVAKSPAENFYNTLRFTTVPTLMDNEDITNISVDGIGKCRLQDDIAVMVQDKPGLHGWLISNQLEDMIVEQVNAQTLAAQMRARMKENSEIVARALKQGVSDPEKIQALQKTMPPESIVKITPVVRAQLTRETAKAGD